MWKGAKQPTIIVVENRNSTCTFGLELDKEYLLFATTQDGSLHINLCSRNQPLATAERDMALLDLLFTDLASPPLHPLTTVTVEGTSAYSTQADQLSVWFVMAEPPADQSDAAVWAVLEQQKALLDELLRAEPGLAPLLDQASLSTNGRDFYLTRKRDALPDDKLLTLLEHLTAFETTLIKDARLPIIGIEVMFALEDCTLPLVTAQRSALWSARDRAGLLAVVMGRAVDTVQSIVEETIDDLSPDGGDVCQALRWRQWHELPLTSNLSTLLNIDVPVKVRVTFGLKPAIGQETPTVAPTFVSPLPTPTPKQ